LISLQSEEHSHNYGHGDHAANKVLIDMKEQVSKLLNVEKAQGRMKRDETAVT